MAELERRMDDVQAERIVHRIKHPVAAYSSIADYLRRRDDPRPFADDAVAFVDKPITVPKTDQQPEQ